MPDPNNLWIFAYKPSATRTPHFLAMCTLPITTLHLVLLGVGQGNYLEGPKRTERGMLDCFEIVGNRCPTVELPFINGASISWKHCQFKIARFEEGCSIRLDLTNHNLSMGV